MSLTPTLRRQGPGQKVVNGARGEANTEFGENHGWPWVAFAHR
jgi:hypothetical protein